jgi:hypothetical protein
MKSKGVAICVMIVVWCFAGLLIDGCLTNRAAAQSLAEPIKIQWEKIGVLPFFKGKRSADKGETLTCPICELSFKAENIQDGADRAMTRHVQDVLMRRYVHKAIPLDEVSRVFQEIPRDDTKDTPRSLARKAGEALGADLMIAGTVWKYRDRIRDVKGPERGESANTDMDRIYSINNVQDESGSERGASVDFEIYLIDVSSGKAVWKTKFDETQRPMTESIRGAKVLLKKGAKWLSADELARYGVEEVFKKFPL